MAPCFNPRARAGRDAIRRPRSTHFVSFNPRARAGRDAAFGASLSQRSQFQSTRPRGARHSYADSACSDEPWMSFNPRARAGRDGLPSIHGDAHAFQSTRPRGARHAIVQAHDMSAFQSTRPRGARLADASRRCLHQPRADLVSIHAPARGATRRRGTRPSIQADVSIHAPARGATEVVAWYVEYLPFQSTRPRGARRDCEVPHDSCQVSIHAPARGATFHPALRRYSSLFQSTRPRGARPAVGSCQGLPHHGFQSTRPRGARRGAWHCTVTLTMGFNPRARAGRDTPERLAVRGLSSFNPRARAGRDLRQ